MSTLLWAVLVVSAVFDGAVLAWFLLRRAPERIGFARLRMGLIAALTACVFKLPVLLEFAGDFFFAINLAYVDTVVVVPLVAAGVLFAARKREVASSVRIAALVGVLLAPIGAYATFVEPLRLVEERVDVPLDPRFAPTAPLRVAVLADMQSRDVDEHLREAIVLAMNFEPHLILLPGDLIQREDEDEEVLARFRELLSPLAAPLGVYFVLGNTDHQALVRRVFAGTNVRLLEDESVEREFGGRKVVIGGADSTWSPAFVADFGRRRADELRILVAHFPDVLLGLNRESAIDLTIAGHTHGGQVRIPFFGPPLTLSGVPRDVAAGGLHAINGQAIYVSRGIGCERASAPRVRFNCPPEVSLLTLRAR